LDSLCDYVQSVGKSPSWKQIESVVPPYYCYVLRFRSSFRKYITRTWVSDVTQKSNRPLI
jgi:hypothetical protein